MSTAWLAALAGACAGASALVVALVRRYALRRGVIDVPNERSSHRAPTPRGGGLGIVVVALTACAALALAGALDRSVAIALGGGGLIVAGIGWLDDHGDLAVGVRLLAQAVAAAWALAWLGGVHALALGAGSLPLGVAGDVLAALALVWLVNLYNFMDGTDALAGTETVTVAGSGAWLLWLAGAPGLAAVAVALAGAAVGFLWWNRPPARIFMGDTGSYFCGYALGVLALAGERAGAVPALAWVVLLAVFWVDATATLVRRMLRREPWLRAHRGHAYQRFVQLGYGHGQLALAVAVLNLGLLAPLAASALWWPSALPPAVGVATLAVLAIWWRVLRVARRRACGGAAKPL